MLSTSCWCALPGSGIFRYSPGSISALRTQMMFACEAKPAARGGCGMHGCRPPPAVGPAGAWFRTFGRLETDLDDSCSFARNATVGHWSPFYSFSGESAPGFGAGCRASQRGSSQRRRFSPAALICPTTRPLMYIATAPPSAEKSLIALVFFITEPRSLAAGCLDQQLKRRH